MSQPLLPSDVQTQQDRPDALLLDGVRRPVRCLGIDGCKAGWAVASADPDVRFQVALTIADAVGQSNIVAVVDIPIGLAESEPRQCDLDARAALPGRKSSVFPAPCRAALDGSEDYGFACDLNQRAGGKRITRQLFGILPKIREVDFLMTPALQARIREAHPELIFATLAGSPMTHKKSSVEGKAERLTVLARLGIVFDPTEERIRLGRSRVQEDDLIDAAACLVTARRIQQGEERVLPGGDPQRDARGLRMEIVA